MGRYNIIYERGQRRYAKQRQKGFKKLLFRGSLQSCYVQYFKCSKSFKYYERKYVVPITIFDNHLELGTDHLVARDPFTVHEAMSSLEVSPLNHINTF